MCQQKQNKNIYLKCLHQINATCNLPPQWRIKKWHKKDSCLYQSGSHHQSINYCTNCCWHWSINSCPNCCHHCYFNFLSNRKQKYTYQKRRDKHKYSSSGAAQWYTNSHCCLQLLYTTNFCCWLLSSRTYLCKKVLFLYQIITIYQLLIHQLLLWIQILISQLLLLMQKSPIQHWKNKDRKRKGHTSWTNFCCNPANWNLLITLHHWNGS